MIVFGRKLIRFYVMCLLDLGIIERTVEYILININKLWALVSLFYFTVLLSFILITSRFQTSSTKFRYNEVSSTNYVNRNGSYSCFTSQALL